MRIDKIKERLSKINPNECKIVEMGKEIMIEYSNNRLFINKNDYNKLFDNKKD